MMNMMLSSSFFGQLKNIILIGVIAVIVIFIIMMLMKNEGGRKILLYVSCFLMITVGVFSGIQLYKEVKAESYVNGSINISNESPSLILIVLLNSFGITILPKSSILLTTPVAFIYISPRYLPSILLAIALVYIHFILHFLTL